jgi:hypothetical protein
MVLMAASQGKESQPPPPSEPLRALGVARRRGGGVNRSAAPLLLLSLTPLRPSPDVISQPPSEGRKNES